MDPILLVLCVMLLGAVGMAVIALAPARTSTIGDRLDVLKGQEAKKPGTLRDQEEMNKSFIVRVLLPLADKVSKYVPTPKGAAERAQKNIAAAGMTGKVTGVQIAMLSYIMGVSALVFIYFITGVKPVRTTTDWLMVIFVPLIAYATPGAVVGGKADRRRNEVLKALPFTLDLISISVEAGVAFDGALSIVAEKTSGPLTDEINLTLREIRLGKGRNDALNDMALRVGVDDLRTFLTAVVYISRLGGSLVDVIRIQATAMRTKRRQRAEEKAMKTPVKIMIPLVLFIFPSMFICILGPAGIQLTSKFATTSQVGGTERAKANAEVPK